MEQFFKSVTSKTLPKINLPYKMGNRFSEPMNNSFGALTCMSISTMKKWVHMARCESHLGLAQLATWVVISYSLRGFY